MKKQRILVSVLALALLLTLAGGITQAQGPGPQKEEMQPQTELSIESAVHSKFSYQGRLTDGGNPVNGSRNMIFRLYSDSSCTTQVGSDIVKGNVQVSDGFFDVELEVDHSDFNGQALWLEVEVGGTPIGCQEILPVPYALSLRPGAKISASNWLFPLPLLQGAVGSSTYWKLGDVGYSRPLVVDSVYGVRGNAPGNSTVDAYGVEGNAETTTSHAYGVYGTATSEKGGFSYGVYGLADYYGVYGLADYYGVYGKATYQTGKGVYGYASDNSGTNYGVYGRTNSYNGYGGYFKNVAGGVDILAAGSGIIKSKADTEIAISPLKAVKVADPANNYRYSYSSGGYLVVNVIEPGPNYPVMIPVDIPASLFGAGQKVKEISVCRQRGPQYGGTYITETIVRSIRNDGSHTDYIDDGMDHFGATSWSCYTSSASTPSAIDGSMVVILKVHSPGDLKIGKIIVTLTEE